MSAIRHGPGPAGRIAELFIDSKVTPLLVIAALALGGLAVSLTAREEEPQIVVPVIDIFVGLPGAGPAEVESRVTIPLEKRMWEIPGVEYVYSASMSDVSLVTVRFYVGESAEHSLVKVWEKLVSDLDRAAEGATPPLVKARAIDDVPVLGLTLWSDAYDGYQLRRIGVEVRREIAAIDEVADVDVIGGQRRQLSVYLDPERMAAHRLDPAAIARALQMQNAAAPAGVFQHHGREVLVETGALLADREDVAGLVVGVSGGHPVKLSQIAEIRDGGEEPSEHVFFMAGAAAAAKGIEVPAGADLALPAVTLAVAKRQGADAHEVVEAVKAKIEELRGRLIPATVHVTVTRDYGATADEKANELLTHLIVAILSVTAVIALSLGWRGAAVVFISVPVSFALTLFVYYVFGYTLNRVTLFALIFVTGIVVDDSIIVVENIVRHRAMGKLPAMQSAIAAVSEVGNPTILATLTVIAAVLPMAFVRGLMGPYMRPMPVGASLAMTFSLLVALVVAPWFALRLLRAGEPGGGHAEEPAIESTRTYRFYKAMLVPLLANPWKRWVFLAVVALLLAGSIALVPLQWVAVKMLPFDNKSEVQVVLDLPEGATLEDSAALTREIAAALAALPVVSDMQLYVGTAAPINFNGLIRHYDLRAGANVAGIQVNLLAKHDRDEQSHAIAKRIRPLVTRIAARHGAAAKVVEIPPGPPVLSTLVAEVYGPDQAARVDAAARVKEIFTGTDNVVDVDWLVEAPQEKLVFAVDHEKAALHGVPAAAIAQTLRLALGGESAGLLHDAVELEPVAIRLQLPLWARSSRRDLAEVRVLSQSGALVAISELVRIEAMERPISLHRKNLKPVVYITGEVAGEHESPVYAILAMGDRIASLDVGAAAGAIRGAAAGVTEGAAAGAAEGSAGDDVRVEQYFRAAPFSEQRVGVKWDGEWAITYEVFRDLGAAFGAVLILIYLLIVGWFGSFRTPLVMMIAIPLALIGVLPGHLMFGAFFTATSMIGFIALAGIMVRNSVLLIDFVNLAQAHGSKLGEAVVEAGAVRLRPILLTAGTVVVGAVVILFDPIFQGLAIALMMGAIASTVLTLVVVPLVHYMVECRDHHQPLPPQWCMPRDLAEEEEEEEEGNAQP
jgi:multidrug efflux pump subunit AcrB